MPAVSGLDRDQRAKARKATVEAALMGLNNISEVHYTQDSRRWEGIGNGRAAAKWPNARVRGSRLPYFVTGE